MSYSYPSFLTDLSSALSNNDGYRLAQLLAPKGDYAQKLLEGVKDSSRLALSRYKNNIISPWDEAEDIRFQQGVSSASSLEDAARQCNKAFSICVTDRSGGSDSKRWGIYHVVGLIFKCYFSANRIALSRNIIRALKANTDIPPLASYPRNDQVTYRYYTGMLSFLNEQYSESESDLMFAFENCYQVPLRNVELILNFLIPLRLLRGQLPSEKLLSSFPRLRELYKPFLIAMRAGDIRAYDAALAWAEPRLVDMGVWLTVERCREVCLRGLFKKVWIVLEKPSRMEIKLFHRGLEVSGVDMPMEEVECMLANMIYKGYMRGYISHERQTVVLAKGDSAFPKLNTRSV
ncbi:COP9 signalosome (CSN) subunit [Tulasnella sp. 419]|nr:COP9 signalosome (CSN) subunit [Tulasnella sp. 419]